MYASSSTVEENVGVLHIFAAPAADPRGFALSGKLHLNFFSCLKFKRSVDMTPLGRIRPLSQNKIYVSGDTKWYKSNTAANYWLDNLESNSTMARTKMTARKSTGGMFYICIFYSSTLPP